MKHFGRDRVFNVVAYLFVGFFALFAVFPFIVLLISSVQAEDEIVKYGYSLVPKSFSFYAYALILKSPDQLLHSYLVTVVVTGIGTVLSLCFSSMAAYVLSSKEARYRNALAFFLFFTTLFSGGLVPYYLLVVRGLLLKNTLLILILANLFSVLNILILRNYLRTSIPESIPESAKIDGANHYVIFFLIILPLLKPVLASVGLLIGLAYWNDWFTPLLFIEKDNLIPLQYSLYLILTRATFESQGMAKAGVATQQLPLQSLKLALTVVSTAPILIVFPFLQRYFIRGITLGSLKG